MKKLVTLLLVMALVLSSCAPKTAEEKPAQKTEEKKADNAEKADDSKSSENEEEAGFILADVRVRQALAYAIDMQTIVDSVFEGKAERAISLTSPGKWLNVDVPVYDYNPEKSKELLKEANWPSDYTLDVVYYYGDQLTVDLMSIIGQYWESVGVKAKFRKLEGDLGAQLWIPPTDRVNGPSEIKWDLAYGGIAALAESEFYGRFSSSASNNSYLPKNEDLDKLIETANTTMNVEEQIKIFKDIQELVAEKLCVIPLYHQVAFIYTSDKLDMAGSKVGNDQFSYEKNILDWTIDREDNTLYTNGGPEEFFWTPMVNPGFLMSTELIFDKLINADTDLNPTDGMLAKDYTVSSDYKSIEFNLRDGLKWHDGEALTGDDVKFTLELMGKSAGLNAVASDVILAISGAKDYVDGSADEIKGIVVDGNKVTVNFDKVSANALQMFSQWPMLPKHLLKDADPTTLQQDKFWQNPVGSGPFMVDEVVLNNYATLKRWDGYYKQGKGNIEKIHMFASSESDANLVKNVSAGKIDYAWSKSTDDAKAIEDIEGMKINVANVRYTRLFYVNQFPHEANAK